MKTYKEYFREAYNKLCNKCKCKGKCNCKKQSVQEAATSIPYDSPAHYLAGMLSPKNGKAFFKTKENPNPNVPVISAEVHHAEITLNGESDDNMRAGIRRHLTNIGVDPSWHNILTDSAMTTAIGTRNAPPAQPARPVMNNTDDGYDAYRDEFEQRNNGLPWSERPGRRRY